MANEQNLRPGEYKFSLEEAKKGGRNSAISRRRKKEFRELFEEILSEPGGTYQGQDVTKKEVIALKALNYLLAKDADLDVREYMEAFKTIRDTLGEKPTDRLDIDLMDSEQSKLGELLEQRRRNRESQPEV